MSSKSLYRIAGRYSSLKRRLPADDPQVVGARRELISAQIEAHIEDLLATEPPLTVEQADRIAALLRGGEG